MDSEDIDRLSAKQKLLLETLLKSRAGESGTAPPRGEQGEDWREPQADRTHDHRNSGIFGGAGGMAFDGAAQAGFERTPPPPAQWLLGLLSSVPLLKMARTLLEKAAYARGHLREGLQRQAFLGEPAQSPLICMRDQGSKTPFFCVHALLGSTFHYFALANLLDEDQPFHALQAPGLDGTEPPLNRIEDFASCYIRFIRQVQPRGPYRIGGYSFGGLVAFEIARQLAREGEEVSHLIIFGTDIPISVSNPALFKAMEFLGQYSRDFHQNLVKPFFSYEKRIDWNGASRKLPFSPTLVRVVTAHCLAALKYNPRPYSGKITLLETLEQQLFSPLDPSRGWDRLTTRNVETRVVSGNHLSMLDEPHIRDLAEKLNACLGEP